MTNETITKDDIHVSRSFRMTKEEFEKLTAIKESIRAKLGLRLSINATLGYVINNHGHKVDANG